MNQKKKLDKDNNPNEEEEEILDLEEDFLIFTDIIPILDEMMDAVDADIDSYLGGLSDEAKSRINSYLDKFKANIEDVVWVELIKLETNLTVLLQNVDELSDGSVDNIYGATFQGREFDALERKLGKEITVIKLDGKD